MIFAWFPARKMDFNLNVVRFNYIVGGFPRSAGPSRFLRPGSSDHVGAPQMSALTSPPRGFVAKQWQLANSGTRS